MVKGPFSYQPAVATFAATFFPYADLIGSLFLTQAGFGIFPYVIFSRLIWAFTEFMATLGTGSHAVDIRAAR